MDEKRIKEFEIMLNTLKRINYEGFVSVNLKTFNEIKNKTDWIAEESSGKKIKGITLVLNEDIFDYKLGI